MVLMNGSKKARLSASLTNQNQGGGPKNMGIVTTGSHPANLLWRLYNNTGSPGQEYYIARYGSTVKGGVGHVAPYQITQAKYNL